MINHEALRGLCGKLSFRFSCVSTEPHPEGGDYGRLLDKTGKGKDELARTKFTKSICL